MCRSRVKFGRRYTAVEPERPCEGKVVDLFPKKIALRGHLKAIGKSVFVSALCPEGILDTKVKKRHRVTY